MSKATIARDNITRTTRTAVPVPKMYTCGTVTLSECLKYSFCQKCPAFKG